METLRLRLITLMINNILSCPLILQERENKQFLKMKIWFEIDICFFLNKIKTKNLKIENCCDFNIHVYILHQVSDFGLSEWKTVTMTATRRTDIADSSERRCTVSHVPPELWIDINTPADRFFDIYSFGICVWETLTGAVPYGSM